MRRKAAQLWVLALSGSHLACATVVREDEAASGGSEDDSPAIAGGTSGGVEQSCASGADLSIVAEGGPASVSVALDGEHAYFSVEDSEAGGAVHKVSLRGEDQSTLATGQSFPVGIVVDETGVAWVDGQRESLLRTSKDGGAVVSLGDASGGADAMLAGDGEYLYMRRWPSTLLRVPVEGGAAEELATTTFTLGGLVADHEAVFVWTLEGAVLRFSKEGGAPTVVADGSVAPADTWSGVTRGIAVDATHVYWMSSSTGQVGRAPRAGGAVEVIATGIENGQDVAVDESSVYWTEDGRLSKVDKHGGSPTALAAADPQLPCEISCRLQPTGIALGRERVYFTNYVTTGPLMSACK